MAEADNGSVAIGMTAPRLVPEPPDVEATLLPVVGAIVGLAAGGEGGLGGGACLFGVA